jgi:anti-anti-sigma factor
VSIQRLGRRLVVAPHGELDLATAPELAERMAEALRQADPGLDEVVMHMTDVGFVDLAGLRSISQCEELAQAHGASFVVADVRPQARRLFELCAVWRYVAQE